MAEENQDEVPGYEPPSVEKALKFFESTLPHRIFDSGQVCCELHHHNGKEGVPFL